MCSAECWDLLEQFGVECLAPGQSVKVGGAALYLIAWYVSKADVVIIISKVRETGGKVTYMWHLIREFRVNGEIEIKRNKIMLQSMEI